MTGRFAGYTVEERLRRNHIVENGCWRWTGSHGPKGYGFISTSGRTRAVHRVAYEIWNGPIPDGLEIDHECRVRDCINPEHLRAMTHRENVRRAVRSRRTHCRRGHRYTDKTAKIRVRNGTEYRDCRPCRHLQEVARKKRVRKRRAMEIGFLLPSVRALGRGSNVTHAAEITESEFPWGIHRYPSRTALCGVRGWGETTGPATCKRCLRRMSALGIQEGGSGDGD